MKNSAVSRATKRVKPSQVLEKFLSKVNLKYLDDFTWWGLAAPPHEPIPVLRSTVGQERLMFNPVQGLQFWNRSSWKVRVLEIELKLQLQYSSKATLTTALRLAHCVRVVIGYDRNWRTNGDVISWDKLFLSYDDLVDNTGAGTHTHAMSHRNPAYVDRVDIIFDRTWCMSQIVPNGPGTSNPLAVWTYPTNGFFWEECVRLPSPGLPVMFNNDGLTAGAPTPADTDVTTGGIFMLAFTDDYISVDAATALWQIVHDCRFTFTDDVQ